MKTATFALAALFGLVASQDQVPRCGQFCVDDMQNGKAEELGCDSGDLRCLCANPNFTYGLRDCSAETCPNEDARQIVAYGVEVCRSNGVAITDAITGGNPTATDGSASASATTFLSTRTSDGSTISVPVSTSTRSSSGGASSTGSSSVVSTVTSGIVTTTRGSTTKTKSETSTQTASASETTGNEEGSETTSGDGGAETTDSGDAAPQRTAAPMGIIAAAGIAALML